MEFLAGLRNGVAVRSSVQAPCRVQPELVPAHGGAELSPARMQRGRKGPEMPHINHGGFNLIESHTVSIPPVDCQSARKPWGRSLEDSPEYGEVAAAPISSSPSSPPFIWREVSTMNAFGSDVDANPSMACSVIFAIGSSSAVTR